MRSRIHYYNSFSIMRCSIVSNEVISRFGEDDPSTRRTRKLSINGRTVSIRRRSIQKLRKPIPRLSKLDFDNMRKKNSKSMVYLRNLTKFLGGSFIDMS